MTVLLPRVENRRELVRKSTLVTTCTRRWYVENGRNAFINGFTSNVNRRK